MEQSIFKYIWKYSKRDQVILLLVTLLTFPILYVSLELPKRIINDAIGGSAEGVTLLGVSFTQVEFLLILCVGFLIAVLANGLLKMRLNTMKGVLRERLLRRFRYQLLTRILRFPRSYFRHTSQGELVSMVTSEAEPLGGIMGNMLSQPVLQAGQMLTILVFLFAQSFWFGLAAIALIPLQAWIIPLLQRQINVLNIGRIEEVRKFSSEIGETAAGVSDIRTNGGSRYRMSMFSDRLGKLFDLRFKIYQKKYFMKFLNNFINQLSPFFFYSVGGFLAIKGEITVGALVAALAAFKDMSSPWKELLTFYNTTQDVSVRWAVVTERFAPSPLIDDDSLFDGVPDKNVNLKGDIEIKDATVRDEEGQLLLEDITLTIPQGARVAVKISSEVTAIAFADLLTREVIPQHGSVSIAGHNLNTIHQETLANGIGYANPNPHIVEGTLGENLLLPFKNKPVADEDAQLTPSRFQADAEKSGNSIDPLNAEWIDPAVAGLSSSEDIREWWFQLVQAAGSDDFMVRRAIRSRLELAGHQKLADTIVQLRPEIAKRLAAAELDKVVCTFHPDKFNPVSPLGTNLLYAMPTRPITQLSLSQDEKFLRIVDEQGISADLIKMSVDLVENLTETFGSDGTDHPLFRNLNLDEELYQRLASIVKKRRKLDADELTVEDHALMLTVPFAFSAEQMGSAFSEEFKQRVLEIRKENAPQMLEELGSFFETIDSEKYIPMMTLMENAIFGQVSGSAGAREKLIEDIIVDVLDENKLRRLAAESIYDLATSSGGDNLPAVFKERLAVSRASIKKPDILILANSLASHDSESRLLMRERISELMPDTTKIFIEEQFFNPESYDLVVEIVDGRIEGTTRPDADKNADKDMRNDINSKIDAIADTELFGKLDRRQQRLLAFGAQWFHAKAGQTIFALGEEADAAYLCVSGLAGVYWTEDDGDRLLVSEMVPGTLIGEVSIILDELRPLDLEALEDSMFLRIGATELMAVIESDAKVAFSLLQTVSGYMMGNADSMRAMRNYAVDQGIDFTKFDEDEADQD